MLRCSILGREERGMKRAKEQHTAQGEFQKSNGEGKALCIASAKAGRGGRLRRNSLYHLFGPSLSFYLESNEASSYQAHKFIACKMETIWRQIVG